MLYFRLHTSEREGDHRLVDAGALGALTATLARPLIPPFRRDFHADTLARHADDTDVVRGVLTIVTYLAADARTARFAHAEGPGLEAALVELLRHPDEEVRLWAGRAHAPLFRGATLGNG